MPRCAACGQENPDGFRFCGACGAELPPAAIPREQRKTVTVLFCDATGSTALGEQLDPEALRRTMGRYFGEIRWIVERHGGTVEKFIGDAVMAVFGIPVAHEDDALRAVRAAGEIRERIGSLGEELGVALSFRTGVNTGEVVAGEGETLVTGDAVNTAARLEQAAPPGEVLLGPTTLVLVRDAVEVEAVEPLELKGKRERVPAFRLVSVDPTAEAFARHLDAPLVGRVREKARLAGEYELAVAERACHLFTLLGSAGVGKSRLVAEFLAGVGGEADVLRARCLHYGDDITYWPLVEILLAIGVEPESVLGTSPAETQLAFRKLLEARAAERPQIVVLDDIQWAEGVFLDLIEHVADWSRDAPIFLLCMARPELLEDRSSWGGGKLNAATILLEPLSAGDCDVLIDELAGDLVVDPDVRRRILAAADGNPLFIEEMLAMVAEGDGQTDVVVPPTIHALLQARLDRLAAEERDVIGRGAVEGQVFHRGAVQELVEEPSRESVPAHLLTLVRKDVIRPDQSTFAGDDAFRFRHLLIRDAAYDALPKETRAELHERFAAWLERHADLVELDEIAGYHLERAYRNRVELDAADHRLESLARRAAARLEAAARGARSRGDFGAASGLLERSVSLLPEGDPQRLEALIGLVEILRFGYVGYSLDKIVSELAASADPRFQAFAQVVQNVADYVAGLYTIDRVEPRTAAADAVFQELGDDLGLAWVAASRWAIYWGCCRAEEAAGALVRGEAHARAAGDEALAGWMRRSAQNALAFGPTHVDVAMRAAQSMLAESTGSVSRGEAQRTIGKLLAMRGELEEAREHVVTGTAAQREAGLLVQAAAGAQATAFVEVRAGDLAAAEQALREGVAELERLEAFGFHGTTALLLADVLADQARYEEAAEWCSTVRARLNEDDLTDVIALHALEGYLAAQAGDHAEGERLSGHAVDVAATIDMYDNRARAYEWHARTLALVGKLEEAREAAATALAIYEAKGDQPAAAWARARLDSFGR